ncbi:MAG: SMC family ATPase [Chloroflexi bacterium]|nr:SMC family ATPase [Chloroflexota bacterium]
MRPLRLELRGFTAFREPVAVDFSGRELFAITGPTGAGKSSLLDGMTWALYGQVPRVGRQTRQLLSHGEQSMSARLDFTARGKCYRVTRRAPAAAGTRLEELLPGEESRPIADRASEVTEQITSLLGLDYATFTKTVLLPQGAFDSFLRGDDQQRRAILTRLLGLGTYEEARRLARARSQTAAEAEALLAAQVGRFPLAAPEARAALDERHRRARERQHELEARRERIARLAELARELEGARAAEAQLAAAAAAALRRAAEASESLAQTRHQREEAEQDLQRVEAERGALELDPEERARLTRELERAELSEEARAALARERGELEAAARAEDDAARRAEACASEARAREESAAGTRARLEEARDRVARRAASARRAARRLEREAAALERAGREADRSAEHERRRAGALDGITERIEGALAAEEKARREAEAGAERERAAARAAAAERAELARAESAHASAREAREAAHRDHAADALRQGLRPGDPCPVCGEAVGALPDAEAPDLDAADRAASDAERALAESRRTAEQAAAREQHEANRHGRARDALAASERQLAALDAELAEAGSERATLRTDADRARAAGAARSAEAEETAARLGTVREQERALALLVERAGAALGAVPLDDAGDDEVAPGAATTALNEELARHEAAADEVSSAEAAVRDAAERARSAAAERRSRVELREQAARSVREAEERLAVLAPDEEPGAGAADIEELRARIEALARAERRADTLARVARDAASAAAAQTAREEERIAEEKRLDSEAARARKEARAGAESAGRVERDLLTLGRTLVPRQGEGSLDASSASALIDAEYRAREEAATELAQAQTLLEQARREAGEAERIRDEAADHRSRAALARALEQELRGNRFIDYVQREAMAVLARDAGARLEQLSSGRYRLIASEDGFTVVDHHNGDEERSVRTLSGGETFLASLALSLALAERLPELAGTGAAVSLESLFLDEGFGALDSESLDLAVQGLETLAGGERMIGVVSHVAEIAERLPDRIEVVPGIHGSAIATD